MARGKKYKASAARVDRERRYPYREAIDLMLAGRRESWNETADATFNLGVDPRHAEQNVRGAVVLPNGTGKEVRLIVFAKGERAREAQEAGADVVGAEELAQRIQDGWLEFDRVIATPDMMGVVGRLGRVLGPRGLMPNPKVGTVTQDVARAVSEQKSGKVEFRVEKTGILHVPFGKCSFPADKLAQNLLAVADTVIRAKPSSSKGVYLKKVSISSTMGPGIWVDPAELQAALAS
jgi:large subunit ribosomal protein L1